ncbi:MAG: hybrid sensor histidine kinase/response regulator [Magnetococcales bacterium]|nr:hybrid sensor histidine kinase/response regulator [Magnetococcales bacterium]
MNKNILIVDDDDNIRKVSAIILENHGFQIFEADNGNSGLEIIRKQNLDLIILDQHMPVMCGITVLRTLRDEERRIPVIMMTADISQRLSVQAFRAGADDFISKPFDEDFLPLVVKRAIKLREQGRHLFEETVRRQAAEKENRLKSIFLENISHNTLTPVHQITGYIDLLQRAIDRENKKKIQLNIARIQKVTQQLTTWMSNISLLAQLEQGSVSFFFTDQSLDQIVATVLINIADKANRKQIQIKKWLDESIHFLADGQKIDLVLQELLDNAVRYAPESSTIQLYAKQEADQLTIFIQNQGESIPAAELKQVFLPFSVSSQTINSGGNRGIGLTLSRHIIKAHNGEIWAEIPQEGGTRIGIRLPLNPG